MRAAFVLLCLAIGCFASSGSAAGGQAQPAEARIQANLRAHKGDFDYLLGDWVFTARHVRYGAYRGLWSAARLPGGQILDEFRPMSEDGTTYTVVTTLRTYDPVRDRWELVSLSERGGLQDLGHAEARNGEMLIEQQLGAPRSTLWRIRYHSIAADHFLWNGDQSADGGKTWRRDALVIDAHRIGPAHAELRLTPKMLPPLPERPASRK